MVLLHRLLGVTMANRARMAITSSTKRTSKKNVATMKKLMKSLMLVAAAAMALTSCENEVLDSVESGENFTMNFIADAPESRTSVTIEGNKASFAWSGDEDFQFIQYLSDGEHSYMSFGSEVTTEKSGDQLLISATFNGEEETEYQYVAIHPASGRATNSNTDFNKNKLIIPGEQTLTDGSYDPNSDLMVSKVVTATGAVSDAQALRFTRLVAIGEMNLKGMQLDGEESIKSVKFSVESAKLTGRCYVDLATATVIEYGYTNEGSKTNEVILTPAEGETFAANATSTKVYFTCAPVELASGSSYTITVDTDKAVYTKSATLGEKALSFGAGNVTAFGVNMATAERTEKVTSTETWSLVTDATALAAGDEVIIAAAGAPVAMSTTQNSNNRGTATITKNENTITFESTAGVQIFELQSGIVTGTFAFYDSASDGYLYAASSSSNQLRTGTLNNNASWAVEIAESGVATIKAQGSYTRNWLRYNSGNSIFSAYGSGQGDVVLYRLEDTRPTLDAPTNVVATAEGETVTVSWSAVSGAKDYTVRAGDQSATTAETTCTLTVGYGKTITASVVANPLSDSYKPSAAAYSNEVQTESNAVTIGEITEEGDYEVHNATVVVTTTKGYLLNDGTGYIYVFLGKESSYNIGNVINISGSVSDYFGMWQFSGSPTTTFVEHNSAFAQPTAEVFDGTKLDAYMAAPTYKYVEISGKLTIDTYINLVVEGSENTASVSYYSGDLSALNNHDVTLRGYLAGSNTSRSYATLYLVDYTDNGGGEDSGDDGEQGGTTPDPDQPVTGSAYVKVTEAPADWSGTYLIVCEDRSVIFDGSLTSFSSTNNLKVDISNGTLSRDYDKYAVTIEKYSTGYSIKTASGKYIGRSANSNGIDTADTQVVNTISYDTSGNCVNVVGAGGAYLRHNSSNQFFRYYKSSTYTAQKAIQLYKLQ